MDLFRVEIARSRASKVIPENALTQLARQPPAATHTLRVRGPSNSQK